MENETDTALTVPVRYDYRFGVAKFISSTTKYCLLAWISGAYFVVYIMKWFAALRRREDTAAACAGVVASYRNNWELIVDDKALNIKRAEIDTLKTERDNLHVKIGELHTMIAEKEIQAQQLQAMSVAQLEQERTAARAEINCLVEENRRFRGELELLGLHAEVEAHWAKMAHDRRVRELGRYAVQRYNEALPNGDRDELEKLCELLSADVLAAKPHGAFFAQLKERVESTITAFEAFERMWSEDGVSLRRKAAARFPLLEAPSPDALRRLALALFLEERGLSQLNPKE